MTSHSIRNILTIISTIQSQMGLSAVRLASRFPSSFQSFQDRLADQIHTAAADIEDRLASSNLSAANLGIRSRRAYQWLRFLSLPGSLALHLDALQRIILFLPRMESKTREGQPGLDFLFYHQGSLYQIRQGNKDVELKVQESYITAPDAVLLALLDTVFSPPAVHSRAVVKEFTFSTLYRQTRQKLEYLGIPPGSFAVGKAHDLWDSYTRVNKTYFGGDLPRPNLVWSNRLTRRKFGHYQWDTDTVMISRTLDHPSIPELVVDYVVYHELLHKQLGSRMAKRNRIAHTEEFRQLEREFQGYSQAIRMLDRIARKQTRSI